MRVMIDGRCAGRRRERMEQLDKDGKAPDTELYEELRSWRGQRHDNEDPVATQRTPWAWLEAALGPMAGAGLTRCTKGTHEVMLQLRAVRDNRH